MSYCQPDGTGGYTFNCPPGYTGQQCKGSQGKGFIIQITRVTGHFPDP